MNNSTINLLYFMYIALCENVLVHEMLESARYRVDKAANSIALLVPRFPLHSLFHHQWWNLAGSLLKKPLFEKIGCNSNIKVTEVVIVFCDHSRNLAQINSKFWRICIKKCLRGPYILHFMYIYNNCVQYRNISRVDYICVAISQNAKKEYSTYLPTWPRRSVAWQSISLVSKRSRVRFPPWSGKPFSLPGVDAHSE